MAKTIDENHKQLSNLIENDVNGINRLSNQAMRNWTIGRKSIKDKANIYGQQKTCQYWWQRRQVDKKKLAEKAPEKN